MNVVKNKLIDAVEWQSARSAEGVVRHKSYAIPENPSAELAKPAIEVTINIGTEETELLDDIEIAEALNNLAESYAERAKDENRNVEYVVMCCGIDPHSYGVAEQTKGEDRIVRLTDDYHDTKPRLPIKEFAKTLHKYDNYDCADNTARLLNKVEPWATIIPKNLAPRVLSDVSYPIAGWRVYTLKK